MDKSNTFDVGRAVLEDYLAGTSLPTRLDVATSEPLIAGRLPLDAPLLTFETDGVLYTFPMSVVLSYNVIQGDFDQPWVMTFCNACNTGMVFDPVVDGRKLHFNRRGSYDGLLIIWDQETNSYWQHITGECLFGSSAGQQLRQIANTRQMRVAEALNHPQPMLLTSPLTPEQEKHSRFAEKMRHKPEIAEPMIMATLASEDTRRPRFELGLGVWDGKMSIFFPLVFMHTHDNARIVDFNGLRMLVYHAPEAVSPVAVYVDDSIKTAYWEGDVLRLNGGAYIKHDMFYRADGRSKPLNCPHQLLMRWYGFAATFPGCGIPRV